MDKISLCNPEARILKHMNISLEKIEREAGRFVGMYLPNGYRLENHHDVFGFVFHKYYYPYEPTVFFEDYTKEEKKFLIQLQENIEESEFILGKQFLQDVQFTINNEEARIYFYAKGAEYSPKFKDGVDTSSFSLSLEPREAAGVILSVIIVINLICFVVYYFLKKKKMNSPNYIKIE